MSSEAKGWDEFSAYLWLNSPKGKASIAWPITEQVPMETVREYIAATKAGDPIRPKLPDPEPIPVSSGSIVTAMDIPTIEQEIASDEEYLLTPLGEFVARIIDLIRIGLEEKSGE